jgi:NAD(P)-dependent dehydrogenase (short-subunit alcohol dehydrogenase family)
MPSVSVAAASNAAWSPTYIPVAVFIGGTSGIGQSMAEAFARYTSGRAHIVIVGRNRSAGESILASMPKPSAEGADEESYIREFVSCDASLMKNVHASSQQLLERLPKINFLVISSGVAGTGGRNETVEGIDRMLALRYYSRFKFIQELLPLVQKGRDLGEDAKVMSILGAGASGAIDVDDLGLKKNYGTVRVMTHSIAYNDYMMEVCCMSTRYLTVFLTVLSSGVLHP